MNLDKQGTIDFIFQYLIFAAENYYVEQKKHKSCQAWISIQHNTLIPRIVV